MPFFDLPPDEELSPEVGRILEEYRRGAGRETVSPSWRIYARLPRVIETRFKAWQNLFHESQSPWDARMVAVMLIAHATCGRRRRALSHPRLAP